ncbi:hypothetical protein FB45DRAFT_987938 [Roridomyces roridus]|uniref:CNNM transmembrane domain-containing protein n=1 Tax=Roridomyces roridus TaxID=1738132 RepID=A0AAD7CBX0_9AGAR|nr:hypothetical protein FB45DRAFT_987938 [Roridomyces roridus]
MFLVLLGGLFAGLTLALMGLDELHLKVLATSSQDPKEQQNATKVMKLLHKGRHWVLVVLLLCNVIINESLPIFLDSAIGGGIAAVALSTTAIVIFGVIPQAFSVRYGLVIGAFSAPFVTVLLYLFAPIAYPIAVLLDWVLGVHGMHTYNRSELKSLLKFHGQGGPLGGDEIRILNKVLDLGGRCVGEIMTPIHDLMTIPADGIYDEELIRKMTLSGSSHWFVHVPEHQDTVIGLLSIEKLLGYNPALRLPISHFPLSTLPEIAPTMDCVQALGYLQCGQTHLLIRNSFGTLGVITLAGMYVPLVLT